MNEVTFGHQIILFVMAAVWFVYYLYATFKYGLSKGLGKSFWGLVLVYAITFVMAFAGSIELLIGVITGVIANELSHKINKNRE